MKDAVRQDLIWMDWAKFLGIFLVVFGHLLQKTQDWRTGGWQYPELMALWNVIYIFHMPLFFMLSGYMYKKVQSFKKIFLTLVIPYLIYQIVFLPAAFAMNLRNEGFSFALLCKHLFGIVLGDGYNTTISYYDCLPCWFIVSIIQVRLFFHFVHITRKSSILLLIICPAILLILKEYDIDFFLCLDSTLMAIPYFLIGHAMAKGELLSRIKTTGGGIICSLICLIVLLVEYRINGPAQMIGPSFGENIFLNYIGGISGSMMVIFIVLNLKRINNNHRLLARNTLFLIFYHWVVLSVLGFIGFFNLWKLIDNYVWTVIIMAMYTLMVLYSSIPVISYLNKNYPIVLGKKKV